MHTVGQNSYIIYKPLHKNYSLLNPKDNMDSIQTDIGTFRCHILAGSSLRAVRERDFFPRFCDLEYFIYKSSGGRGGNEKAAKMLS